MAERLEGEAVSELLGIGRFKIHEGKLDEFKDLSEQCMAVVRSKDSGNLEYGVYLNEDESEAIVVERYRDSKALIEHTANIGDLGKAIQKTGSLTGELLGVPSAELEGNLSDSDQPRLFTPFLET